MIPRLAALSIAEISARTCSGPGVCTERTLFSIVRRPVTTLRLRSDRFSVWRARLAADFVFAIVIKKVKDLHARERVAVVNPEGSPSPPSCDAQVSHRPRGAPLQSFVQFQLGFLLPSSKCPTLPHLFYRQRIVGGGSRNWLLVALRFCACGYKVVNRLRSRCFCDFR